MARLVLEDGSVYYGTLFGSRKSIPGEVGKKVEFGCVIYGLHNYQKIISNTHNWLTCIYAMRIKLDFTK